MKTKLVLTVLAAVFLGWAGFVMAVAFNQIPFFPGGSALVQTGLFGDSFGFLSAGMASLAAYFSFQAWNDAKSETAEVRARDIKRDNEATFFRMIELRREVRNDVTIGALSGLKAIKAMSGYLLNAPGKTFTEQKAAREGLFKKHHDAMASYFRYTYHMLRFAHERFDPRDAYQYVRLLRAELDNSEAILLTTHGWLSDEGAKLGDFVLQFKLYDNITQADRFALSLYRWVGSDDQPGS